jgi:hypothetical protein
VDISWLLAFLLFARLPAGALAWSHEKAAGLLLCGKADDISVIFRMPVVIVLHLTGGEGGRLNPGKISRPFGLFRCGSLT